MGMVIIGNYHEHFLFIIPFGMFLLMFSNSFVSTHQLLLSFLHTLLRLLTNKHRLEYPGRCWYLDYLMFHCLLVFVFSKQRQDHLQNLQLFQSSSLRQGDKFSVTRMSDNLASYQRSLGQFLIVIFQVIGFPYITNDS